MAGWSRSRRTAPPARDAAIATSTCTTATRRRCCPRPASITRKTTSIRASSFSSRRSSVMVMSKAATVEEYLESLPEDRREVIAAVRKVILKNLPKGYEERMNWGMITYEVPLETYPHTYNGQPLCYAGLAAQ